MKPKKAAIEVSSVARALALEIILPPCSPEVVEFYNKIWTKVKG